MSGGHGKIRTRKSTVDSNDAEAEKKRKAAVRAAAARKKARQNS
jgi:hypothetical protein